MKSHELKSQEHLKKEETPLVWNAVELAEKSRIRNVSLSSLFYFLENVRMTTVIRVFLTPGMVTLKATFSAAGSINTKRAQTVKMFGSFFAWSRGPKLIYEEGYVVNAVLLDTN